METKRHLIIHTNRNKTLFTTKFGFSVFYENQVVFTETNGKPFIKSAFNLDIFYENFSFFSR